MRRSAHCAHAEEAISGRPEPAAPSPLPSRQGHVGLGAVGEKKLSHMVKIIRELLLFFVEEAVSH